MKVTLIGFTHFDGLPESVRDTAFWEYDSATHAYDADRLAHFAGRSCYQAWGMPRESTSTDMGYLANIIKQGHFSVLEHGSATFYIEGISRNCSHEILRHRHLSFSELSQRFVDMKDAKFVVPPAVRDFYETDDPSLPVDGMQEIPEEFIDSYTCVVNNLTYEGLTRKQAREAARAYLPSSVETKIVVTGNHRAWRDMLQKRYSVHADREIMELAAELLKQLRLLAPGCYQDFLEEPFQ